MKFLNFSGIGVGRLAAFVFVNPLSLCPDIIAEKSDETTRVIGIWVCLS